MIILSAGHNLGKNTLLSREDRGAQAYWNLDGIVKPYTEYDVVQSIIWDFLSKYPTVAGQKVIQIPTKLNITQRLKWLKANAVEGRDTVIELHMDAGIIGKSTGSMAYYRTGNHWAEDEVKQFMVGYSSASGIPTKRVVESKTSRFGKLGIIDDSNVFTFLVEMGFITNVEDLKKVRKNGAKAIKAGLDEMFA